MGHCYPAKKRGHRLVLLWRENHVPVVAHPLIGDQINGVFFQAFADYSLKGFKVCLFKENIIASVSAIQGMVNFTRAIRTKWATARASQQRS